MLDKIQGNFVQSISATCNSASEETTTRKSASDGNDWFVEMAQGLLGKPGLELHLITGYDESLCYRYASGATKPPAYFLRAIVRSEHGAPFLAAIMRDSNAGWWSNMQRALRIAAQIDKLDLR